MRSPAFLAAVMGMALYCEAPAAAQNALTLEKKIPLGDVRGRIDHMSSLPGRLLSTRRLILLATAANLGIAAAAVGYVNFPQTVPLAFTQHAVAAENAPRPTGFAYLVEKVKPAVISVQVKMDGGATMRGMLENEK